MRPTRLVLAVNGDAKDRVGDPAMQHLQDGEPIAKHVVGRETECRGPRRLNDQVDAMVDAVDGRFGHAVNLVARGNSTKSSPDVSDGAPVDESPDGPRPRLDGADLGEILARIGQGDLRDVERSTPFHDQQGLGNTRPLGVQGVDQSTCLSRHVRDDNIASTVDLENTRARVSGLPLGSLSRTLMSSASQMPAIQMVAWHPSA